MLNLQNTLRKAYSIIEENGNSSTFEIDCIRHLLISPSHILAFEDCDLYLKYIKNLVKESGNAAFPDKKSSYDTFFRDCVFLKNQMKKNHDTFLEEDYLSYTTRLLENL